MPSSTKCFCLAKNAKSDPISRFKSNARETWCVILVSASWHLLFRITAHPRGAFISVGDWTPTEKYLLLLTTCRSGSLNSDWDEWKRFEISVCQLNLIGLQIVLLKKMLIQLLQILIGEKRFLVWLKNINSIFFVLRYPYFIRQVNKCPENA